MQFQKVFIPKHVKPEDVKEQGGRSRLVCVWFMVHFPSDFLG